MDAPAQETVPLADAAASGGELHLFVVWPRGAKAADRIFADLAAETELLWRGELRFDCDMALAYRRFYGPALPDAARKVRNCGSGPFHVAVVRDPRPERGVADDSGRIPVVCDMRMWRLKKKYREWAGGGHRVHGTLSPHEFERDVFMLTGVHAAEWEKGVPSGRFSPRLPDGWLAVSSPRPFAPGGMLPVFDGDGRDKAPLEDAKVFLENKYINDVFLSGRCMGIDAVEKRSSKAIRSIGNEYRLASAICAADPSVAPRPLAWRFAADGSWASVASERLPGPSLSVLLERGIAEAQADVFAGDFLRLAGALEKTGIVHRDLFADNFLLGADGHLRAIDWQLAIDRNLPREDPWVVANWKFRYVVFGVNRDLPLGVWNDFLAMDALLRRFPPTKAVAAARASLAARAPAMTYSDPPRFRARLGLALYAVSLRIQMMLRGRGHRKYPQLLRRYRTIVKPKEGK